MHRQNEAFLELLLIELDDLEADMRLVETEYREKHAREKISEYIFQENLALTQRELFGVDGFRRDVRTFVAGSFANLADLVAGLQEKLETRVRDNGLPRAMILMINRKLDKVRRYVES